MARVLDDLHEDHKNIARVLALLNHELETLANTHSPDYELVEDIMRYVTGYPDTHHHPTEDIVFQHLKERAPETAADIAAILAEHHRLVEAGTKFLKAIEAVEHEAMMPRTRLLALGRAYAELLEGHMDSEEGNLFPRARAQLTEADWEAIAAEVEARPDPLFGPARQAEFRNLLQRINDHAPA
jgi:hemerythrin-like domain-containing protein